MNKELKQAIVNYIFENENEFSLNHSVTSHFKAYIYDSEGYYLIGGKEVGSFIHKAIELLAD